jgi:hypothetical protein
LLEGFVNFLVSHQIFYKMLEEGFGYQQKKTNYRTRL